MEGLSGGNTGVLHLGGEVPLGHSRTPFPGGLQTLLLSSFSPLHSEAGGLSPSGVNKGIRQVNPPLQHLGTKSQGPIPDALKSPRSFPLYLRVDRGRGKGVDWPRNLRRATPAKRVTLLIRGDAVGGTAAPPPSASVRLGESWTKWGWGNSLPSPAQESLGREVVFV